MSISKKQLAMLYFPDADPRTASQMLRRWITRCPDLVRALTATGYVHTQRVLSTRQANLIMHYLGDP